MTASQVYEKFKTMFPDYLNENIVYFPNGKNSIRLRGIKDIGKGEMIFTISNDGSEWKLESVNQFLKRLQGED